MAQTIKIKRGLKSSLPVLLEGELGYTTDTNEVYISDGTNNYKFISENDIVTSISDPGSDSVIPSEQAVRESLYTDSDVDTHLTGGTGISYSTGTITNTDTGSDAVTSHESTYNHTAYLTDITNESIGNLSDVDTSGVSDGYVLEYNSTSGNWEVSSAAGGASSLSDLSDVNVGSPTAGQLLIYDATNSEFVNSGITAGTGISKTEIDGSLTISTDDSNIDHDALTNFVANEHIDHSGVSITAGDGLSGGGDITTSRTLNVELDIEDSGTNVNTGHGLNFNSNLSVTDDTDGTFTIDVPNDLTVMSNYDTGDLTEGTNLYFTDARAQSAINSDTDHGSTASHNYYTNSDVDAHLTGGTGIDYSTGTISIDSTVVQTTDTDVSGNSWVLDEDGLTSNSATKVATQQSIKAYIDTNTNLYGDSDVNSYLANNHIDVQTLEVTGTTKSAGYFYTGTTAPTNTTRLNYDGYFYATRVYNAVYNDLVDFIEAAPNEEIVYGRVYFQDTDGLKLANMRCQMGVVGISSDTYGFALGYKENDSQVPIGISGWVLAKVDKEYPIGTPLTNNENGELTRMEYYEKIMWPERMLATMGRKEINTVWNNKVEVNGRYWVKIKG